MMAFKQVRLGDYFKFEKGLGYKGEFLAEESDVALIGMDSHEEGGGYKEGSEKFYTGPFKSEHIAEVGDVIFAGTEQGFGLLASPLVVPESDKFTTYLFSGDVLKAIPLKPDAFSLEYLYNLYRVEKFRVKTAYGDTGTTVRRISNENFAEQIVPLPDLLTQQAINDVISLLDQQIANSRLLSRNLVSLMKSIFYSEITSRIDVENYSELGLSHLDELQNKIPPNWRVSSLADNLSALESGKRPKGGGSSDNSGMPSIGAESITGIGEFNFAKTKYIPIDFYNKMKSGIVRNLDVLVYKDGAGAGNFVSIFGNGFPFKEFCINEHVFLLRSNGVTQNFLYLWMDQRKVRDLMVELAQKSAQPGLNKSDMAGIPIVIPTNDVLERLEKEVSPLIEKILENSVTNRALELTIQSILPRLVTGELELPTDLIAS